MSVKTGSAQSTTIASFLEPLDELYNMGVQQYKAWMGSVQPTRSRSEPEQAGEIGVANFTKPPTMRYGITGISGKTRRNLGTERCRQALGKRRSELLLTTSILRMIIRGTARATPLCQGAPLFLKLWQLAGT